jgi:hypothetical protein
MQIPAAEIAIFAALFDEELALTFTYELCACSSLLALNVSKQKKQTQL